MLHEMQHRLGPPHWLRVEPPRQLPQIHTCNTYRRMFFTDGTHFVPRMVRFLKIIILHEAREKEEEKLRLFTSFYSLQ